MLLRKVALALAVLGVACARGQPPGAERKQSGALVIRAAENPSAAPSGNQRGSAPAPGSLEDNLPFVPNGQRAASIAWRNWVYTDVGPKRTRYGYLRLGAVVDELDARQECAVADAGRAEQRTVAAHEIVDVMDV